MKTNSLIQNKILIAFYSFLLIVFFLLMRPGVEMPMLVRVGMMVLCFIPVFFKTEILPFVVLCFRVISSSSFSPVLPSIDSFYLIIVLLFYVLYRHKTRFVIGGLVVLIYYYIVSSFYHESNQFLSWLFVIVMLSDMIMDEKDLNYLFYAFLMISAFLSVLYIVHRSSFVMVYGRHTSDLERSGWINANMFGAAIGAGAVLCVAYLTELIKFYRTKLISVVCIITLIMSFYVITSIASRGAFFAFVIPSLLMLLMSKTKFWLKLLIGAIGLFVVVWMIKNNTFNLLTARINENSFETGGSRITIWQLKLNYFFEKNNLLSYIFGIGVSECNKLGLVISTHNDFITAFIAYGLVGFLLFVHILLYPIRIAHKRNRFGVIILLLFVFIECFVLEPFFRGYIFVTMYYVFVMKYVRIMELY